MTIPSSCRLLFSIFHFLFLSISSHSKVLCIDKEKTALLDFKLSFVEDSLGVLLDWSDHNDPDCCAWEGVVCDDQTGRVITLSLGEGLKSYQLRPSLLELQHLTSLYLSGNQFPMRIPKFIGSLSNLTNLDLSETGFFGEIPPHLGNLSKLEYLNLGQSDFRGLYAHNLQWLSRLSFLVYLDLPGVDLSKAIDWVSAIKRLPVLSAFLCGSCSLPPPLVSSTSYVNLSTSLQTLDLSNNSVNSSLFSWVINGSTNLQTLRLNYMRLESNIDQLLEALAATARYSLEELTLFGNNLNKLPFEVTMFPSLRTLKLPFNQLSELPGLFALTSLRELDVSFNRISGSFPKILQSLPTSQLTRLDLSSNSLNGVVSDSHFSSLFRLRGLLLSGNSLLKFNFSKSWVPPFQLYTLMLSSCKVGPSFPDWILTQKSLHRLEMSNSRISGAIPRALWDFSTRLQFLNLSYNNISCILPNSDLSFYAGYVDLSYNTFHGPVPQFLFTIGELFLSNNRFSSFPPFFLGVLSSMTFMINLSNNHLSGSLPNWLFQFDQLLILNLENNNLSGTLPDTIGSLSHLTSLHLSNNGYSGQLPLSMRNCTHLAILELENNKFHGVVPSWIGESMPHLVVLSLGSNYFAGDLPPSLCYLQSLQVLDLSSNKLSGTIPDCLHNFSSMTTNKGLNLTVMQQYKLSSFDTKEYTAYIDFASVMWRGVMYNLYSRSLEQRNVINLSGNQLSGEIPIGVTALVELRSLDLSSNYLNGSIPDKIGQLTLLDVLELSSNRLCGEIPQSLGALTFLGTLNLSNNNLSDRIPTGTHLWSFDASSYVGNPELCGLPLPTKCPGDEDGDKKQHLPSEDAHDGDDESFDIQAFLAALGMGFAIGLLGVLGTLHFYRPWRLAFFWLADNFAYRILLATSLFLSRIKRNLCLR